MTAEPAPLAAARPSTVARLGWSGRIAVHQIHLARRLVVVVGGIAGAVVLWLGHAELGLVVAIVPALAVSALVVARGDLDRLAATPAGRRALETITASHAALRAIGAAIALCGAWYHDVSTLVAGVASILVVWRVR